MFLNILHFFSGLFPRFSPGRQRLAAIMRPNFRSLRAPITKRSVKARLLAAVKQQTGKLEFDELSNSRSLRLAHRQNASFRTSPQTGVGISIELWATHRHTDRPFVPFSGIYPREVVRLTGGLPRQCALLYRNDREFDKFQFYDLLINADNLNSNLPCQRYLSFRLRPAGLPQEHGGEHGLFETLNEPWALD